MDAESYDHLMRAIYDGVMAEDGWHNALVKMLPLARSEQGALITWNESNSVDVAGELELGHSDDARSVFSFYDADRPLVGAIATGQWHFDPEELGAGTLACRHFQQEFMRQHDFNLVMWTPLVTAGRMHATLSFQRGRHRPQFLSKDAAAIEPLLPHLIRAVKLRWRYEDLSRMAQVGKHVLDRLHSPILVINAKAQIQHANAAAQDWLSTKHHPFSYQSWLKQATPWPELSHLAEQICRNGTVAAIKTAPAQEGGPFTYLIGLPLRENHPLAIEWYEPTGIVVVHDPSCRKTAWSELLQRLFGLTPAECRVMEQLSAHHSIDGVAETLALGRETVRTHLKSIFKKTGSPNQSALMQLITELSHLH